MEGREGVSSGVTVVGSDAPSDYHVAPRSENQAQTGGSTTPPPVSPAPPAAPATTAAPSATTAPAAAASMPAKKKRGRPRKYGPDGTVTMALSPKPISSSAPPPVIDFSAEKRGKVRPASSVNKTKYDLENLGNIKKCLLFMHPFGNLSGFFAVSHIKFEALVFIRIGLRCCCVGIGRVLLLQGIEFKRGFVVSMFMRFSLDRRGSCDRIPSN